MPGPRPLVQLSLIEQLLLYAGRLIEDAAPQLALAWPAGAAAQALSIESLRQLACDLNAIADAAAVLHRRKAGAG
jgi:hypothetical protein